MKYQMTQKMFSLGDCFTIKDGEGADAFFVRGKVFSMGDKLSLQDPAGQEVAYIAQKLMSLKKRYEIYRDGRLFADVVKEISFFKDKFTIDIPGPNDYEVSGNLWDHEYIFTRSGRQVATVSKKLFAWSDSYGVAIVDGEDDVTILATAIVIDLVKQDERRR